MVAAVNTVGKSEVRYELGRKLPLERLHVIEFNLPGSTRGGIIDRAVPLSSDITDPAVDPQYFSAVIEHIFFPSQQVKGKILVETTVIPLTIASFIARVIHRSGKQIIITVS